MKITKKELLEHCADATKELIEKMEPLDGRELITLTLTTIAFTSALSKRMFPEEE